MGWEAGLPGWIGKTRRGLERSAVTSLSRWPSLRHPPGRVSPTDAARGGGRREGRTKRIGDGGSERGREEGERRGKRRGKTLKVRHYILRGRVTYGCINCVIVGHSGVSKVDKLQHRRKTNNYKHNYPSDADHRCIHYAAPTWLRIVGSKLS